MLVSDLLHSCANDCVAEAAISSIGGVFASRIQSEAEIRGVSVGHFASGVVRDFARGATERDWRDLIEAVRGTDAPVLVGLEVILTRRPQGRRMQADRVETRPKPFPAMALAALG